jgi:hypothetical protein
MGRSFANRSCSAATSLDQQERPGDAGTAMIGFIRELD